ncbi:hypothetical protein Ccrd_010280 [Cynara cardunculus var. scolymus]|uniref:Uncharacterized protein n=1 Tax=Cynara cardunculus var. scolymus TaxID=59895 RepID=A0A124SI19_CYNCS|nr:hypothetical protein Ccrd_010280 [Cynara cardunculus var. scolymus]
MIKSKHQLAARLAVSLGTCDDVKVSDEQLAQLLAKVSKRSTYGAIALLNRSFCDLIRSGELYKLKRVNGIIEHWVYYSCNLVKWEAFDPISRKWMLLPKMAFPWEKIQILLVQWHALGLGLFASIIAPFGGFFAFDPIGWKRADNFVYNYAVMGC